MPKRGTIHVGTSGWSYPHWRGTFYEQNCPPRKHLETYARHFQTAEVNNSFYQLPSNETVQIWRDTVPDDFCFAIKASRYLTHMKKLKDPEEPVERLLGVVCDLKDKLGPILVQLPPNWNKNPERLQHFLEALPTGQRWAFEFRDPSWFDAEIYELLSDHNAALCIYNQDGKTSPVESTADWVYIRMHGPANGNGWSYDGRTLSSWAKSIERWASEGQDVYCYFNNDLEGAAPNDARKVIDFLDR
jgi:uncharacterized protein YecE (DUF72 family)